MTYPLYDWRDAFHGWQTMPPVTMVGVLPDALAAQVALPTSERRILVHQHTIQHIHDRRSASLKRITLALRGLPETVTMPDYIGCTRDIDGRTSVLCIKTIDPAMEPVLVAIKWVPAHRAAAAQDELLVSTAYPAHFRYLKKLIARGIVHAVRGG